MKRLIPLLALLLVFPLAAPAQEGDGDSQVQDCISVSDEELEIHETELGFGEGEWRARVSNDCDRAVDLRLSVQMVDAEGEVLTQYTVVSLIPANGGKDVTKELYLTSRDLKAMDSVEWVIEGSRQPM
ncbi:hypothetical protein SAMN05660831_02312 [Thiohalospira halophila DSM 15071]|uniref:Uncharacterized protein n=1 Tax=Thiohalospira halophila DSM 15071 TaxID=1123397 RepID=A0A1I1V9Y4_9GAMM|nr:hypothetical protein [Thiohalospira halophila]SFD79822.1 hypothetical protein SAMN05660831_02312 [Thiohalospira halophila DSM 15071]